MSKILIVVFCFLSFMSFASEYKVSLLGLESMTDIQWGVTAINDKGQVLGGYQQKGTNQQIFLYDFKNGLTLIDSKDMCIQLIKLNNAEQILGCENNRTFIWSRSLGVHWLDVFKSKNIGANDLNDLGQIIGRYLPLEISERPGTSTHEFRSFLWDNGVVSDMGPGSDFAKEFEVAGYHAMDIKLTSINNTGHIVGFFTNGKYNKIQKKYVAIETVPFYWDGDLHIVPVELPVNFSSYEHQLKLKLNNQGVVLIVHPFDNCQSYLWDRENGLQVLQNFAGFALNDSNEVLGWSSSGGTSIWRNDRFITFSELLGVNIHNMAPSYSESYSIERIDCGWNNMVSLNNKGQVPCIGYIWGERYPCILEPITSNP